MEEEISGAEIPNNTNQPSTIQDDTTTTTTTHNQSEFTVDEVIEKYVGSFGRAQIIQAILVSLAWMFDAQSTLVTIFSDAKPDEWRCMSKAKGLCHGQMSGKGSSVCGLQQGTWVWVDGLESSIIAEWGLLCHRKFLAALPASSFFLGSIIGAAIYGRLADTLLGRKKTLILACFLTTITAFLTSLSPNIWTYAVLRFFYGLTRSGIGICCLVLTTEVVGRKRRGQVGQYGFFFFTLGFLSLPLISFCIKSSWRWLYRTLSILVLFYSIIILPFVKESPRWLLIQGREVEALEILTNLASRNGKKLPENIQLKNPSLVNDDQKKGMSLWQCKWARMRMAKAMITGFGAGFVYYAYNLNVENLNFTKYLSVAFNASLEIPAVFVGSFLLGFMKRRLLLSLSCFLAGGSCFLCIIFTKGRGGTAGRWIQVGIEGFGFLAASMAFDLMFIYCVELFPTNVRNFAVSLMSQALVLGGAVTPLLVVVGRFNPSISFLVIGVASFISGLMSYWLPETKNVPVFQTLEQQEKEEKLGLHGRSRDQPIPLDLTERMNLGTNI